MPRIDLVDREELSLPFSQRFFLGLLRLTVEFLKFKKTSYEAIGANAW
jgi:hypothetical protein